MIVKDRPTLPPDTRTDARAAVELLSRGSTYGEKTGSVERLETHISWLFLTKRRVYKLKKPVRFDFLDYGTVQRRKQACEAEVQLNRRLAPHTYLGVIPLIRSPRGRLQLGGYGTPVDWVVVMRRLDAEQSLDALIRSGRVTRQQVDQLATRLSDFYRQLPPLTIRAGIPAADRGARASEPSVVARGGRRVGHRGRQTRVRRSTARPHAGAEWLENRACDGRVVEGHGDLRPDHIYFQPGPIVIDCVEFSSELRQLDVLDELSFLAMECDIRQAGWIGRHILERYDQTNGDHPPEALLSFYKCYRATVHAKVAALRAEQHPTDPQASEWSLARQYVQLADTYAAGLGPPLLVVLRGPAGCGKSTLAGALSDTLGLECLQTDTIRRELFPVPGREGGRRAPCIATTIVERSTRNCCGEPSG